jgi:hypothetical protein
MRSFIMPKNSYKLLLTLLSTNHIVDKCPSIVVNTTSLPPQKHARDVRRFIFMNQKGWGGSSEDTRDYPKLCYLYKYIVAKHSI